MSLATYNKFLLDFVYIVLKRCFIQGAVALMLLGYKMAVM